MHKIIQALLNVEKKRPVSLPLFPPPPDPKSGKRIRLTTEEKERIYLDAVQSYYYSGRELLLQSEFDLLKEDLQWSGSEVR